MFVSVLIILLLLMLLGTIPKWPYNRHWSYYPSGGVSLLLLILVIVILRGGLHLP